MQIMQKSIRIIDYEQKQIISKEIPETFDNYVTELIEHIRSNHSVREYKTRSNETEVIGSILTICENQTNEELVSNKMDGVATRLLLKEIDAQDRIARTRTNVQKGSLVQALLFEEEADSYIYLLAKVPHSEWVDDTDFTFKTGFSKDKKTIWKSCLIDLLDLTANEFYAKIYSDAVAKYWCEDFLELVEMNSDESNTARAFKAIDSTLGQNFRNIASVDHTIIRNAFISYFKNHNHIDFPTMVNTILDNYQPADPTLPEEKIQSIKEKLLILPQKKKFDSQFNAVNSAINARIRKVYPINEGIDLKITRAIEDLPETVQSIEENGIRYIRVRTNNEETFKKFLMNPI